MKIPQYSDEFQFLTVQDQIREFIVAQEVRMAQNAADAMKKTRHSLTPSKRMRRRRVTFECPYEGSQIHIQIKGITCSTHTQIAFFCFFIILSFAFSDPNDANNRKRKSDEPLDATNLCSPTS